MKKALLALAFASVSATAALAQSHSSHNPTNHADHIGQHGDTAMVMTIPTETGQSAFAAVAEIVALLQTDPNTDWSQVNIDALRAHLVDMNTVTLMSDVTASRVDNGAVFDVTASNPKTTASIRRMLLAHGKTMSGNDGLAMASAEIAGGARLTVTGPNPTMIRGLGFFGVMTLGMHHQAHHMALASGRNPHH